MDNYRELKIRCYPGFGHLLWAFWSALNSLNVLVIPLGSELRIKLAAKTWTIIENSKFAVTHISDTYLWTS